MPDSQPTPLVEIHHVTERGRVAAATAGFINLGALPGDLEILSSPPPPPAIRFSWFHTIGSLVCLVGLTLSVLWMSDTLGAKSGDTLAALLMTPALVVIALGIFLARHIKARRSWAGTVRAAFDRNREVLFQGHGQRAAMLRGPLDTAARQVTGAPVGQAAELRERYALLLGSCQTFLRSPEVDESLYGEINQQAADMMMLRAR